MTEAFARDLASRIETLKTDGLYKQEQVIASPQHGEVILRSGDACINLCSNNYPGLSNHPRLIEAAMAALSDYGFGMSSVRFICGPRARGSGPCDRRLRRDRARDASHRAGR